MIDNAPAVCLLMIVILVPVGLTLWNVISFAELLRKGHDGRKNKIIEPLAVISGFCLMLLYIFFARNILCAEWFVQLHNNEVHFMIAPEYIPTINTLLAVSCVGYCIIRYIPSSKLSPIVIVISISAMYIGIGVCLIWCVQIFPDIPMMLYALNCVLILIKTICIIVKQYNSEIKEEKRTVKFAKLAKLLDNGAKLPLLAFVAIVPLLGVAVEVLTLFGQEPTAIIKAWTETADWTLSQKIPPQNIHFDEHYLCTVAAGGHRSVVKPLRTGKRHGHRVVVNRQLCIANAFEELIQQRTPRFHKTVRTIYDSTGYPIAKHIRNKFVADIIYFAMKPLEWIFLITLYMFTTDPENRIAVQYPHTELPEIKSI